MPSPPSQTFAQFMQDALYHPEHGFYRRSDHQPFGREGHFYTAVQLMPVFGEVLTAYIRRLAKELNGDRFEVIDLGAGHAGLREALMSWPYVPVDWGLDSFPSSIRGVVIANEFFDALPVHLLERRRGRWSELLVSQSAEGGRIFTPARILAPELREYAERYGVSIPEGGRLEANLELGSWVTRIATSLQKGRLLVIDYGYATPELARFPSGTLMSYRHHIADPDVLANPGERDITALVNFTELKRVASEAGLHIVNEASLGSWILQQFTSSCLEERWSEVDERWRMQWKNLVFALGAVFQVLEFEKSAGK